MIEIIGWAALGLGGAYVAFTITLVIATGSGGLEAAIKGIVWGVVAAVAWLVLIAWLSPLTIGFSGTALVPTPTEGNGEVAT